MKNPWMKFYPSDWRGDAKLRMCSIAARGLWLEMLAIAHEAEEYGYVTINGKAPTNLQLAKMVGEDESWVTQWVTELENSGVFSRTSEGVIYSRRMVRDYKKAEVSRENGKTGGSSKHKKNKDDLDLGNLKPTQQVTEILKLGSQNLKSSVSKIEPDDLAPDTRYQIPDYSVSNDTDAFASRVVDVGKQVWEVGLKLLDGYGIPEKRARPILGKWVKAAGSESKLLEVLNEAGSEERAEIVSFVEAALKPKEAVILVDWLYGLQGGPMKRTTAEFQVESWVGTLGLDAVTEAITKAKSVGWKRDKTIEHLDSLAAGKTRDNYEKRSEITAMMMPIEDPDWAAVKSEMCSEDPKAKSWLGDMVKAVNVNPTSVKIRAATRVGAEQIGNYTPRLLELFKLQKPGIEIVEVGL